MVRWTQVIQAMLMRYQKSLWWGITIRSKIVDADQMPASGSLDQSSNSQKSSSEDLHPVDPPDQVRAGLEENLVIPDLSLFSRSRSRNRINQFKKSHHLIIRRWLMKQVN